MQYWGRTTSPSWDLNKNNTLDLAEIFYNYRLWLGSPPYSPEINWTRAYLGSNTYWDSSINKWKRFNLDGNVNASMIWLGPGQGSLLATNDFYNSLPIDNSPLEMGENVCLSWSKDGVNLYTNLKFKEVLPSSADGLEPGTLWRDINGGLNVA